jgi:hypothetical protein
LIYSKVAGIEKQFLQEREAIAAFVLLFTVIQLTRRHKVVSSRLRRRGTEFIMMKIEGDD